MGEMAGGCEARNPGPAKKKAACASKGEVLERRWMRGIKPKRLATQDAWVCPALRRAGALLAVSPTAGSASAITRHSCGVWAPR